MQTLLSTYGEVTVNNGNVTAGDGNVTINRPHRSAKHTYFYTAKKSQVKLVCLSCSLVSISFLYLLSLEVPLLIP